MLEKAVLIIYFCFSWVDTQCTASAYGFRIYPTIEACRANIFRYLSAPTVASVVCEVAYEEVEIAN